MIFLTKCWCCICLLCCWQCISLQAGILPLMLFQKSSTTQPPSTNSSTNTISPAIAHRFAGYIEYLPNGTITLRSDALENTTNWQNLLLFKTILKAIKLTAPLALVEASKDAQAPKINIKIYGEGIEHKFPPFLERIIQRIQTFFSVYRYSDTSQALASSSTLSSSTPDYATYSHFDDTLTANYITSTSMNLDNDEHTEFIEYSTDFPTTTSFGTAGDSGDFNALNDDYNEFISIGEANDGFITVGED